MKKTILKGTNKWSDYANSNPIGDIKEIGVAFDTIIIGRKLHKILLRHPDIAIETTPYKKSLPSNFVNDLYDNLKDIKDVYDEIDRLALYHALSSYGIEIKKIEITNGYIFEVEKNKEKVWEIINY